MRDLSSLNNEQLMNLYCDISDEYRSRLDVPYSDWTPIAFQQQEEIDQCHEEILTRMNKGRNE